MKLKQPAAPFERLEFHGDSVSLDTEGKVLVLPSGNPDILPSHNEYTLNSNRLTIAESPFGGLKGPGSPDYAPGTVNIIEGDGVYLQDVNGQNSSKTLSAGKLKELNLLSVDTTNHSITEEFVVKNTSVSNNPTVISDGTTIEGWSAGTGTLTSLTTENGRIKAVGRGTISVGFKIIKTVSLTGKQFLTFKIECNTNKNLFVSLTQGVNKVEFRGTRFPIPANAVTSFVLPIHAPAGAAGLYPSTVSGTIDWANDVTLYIGTDQTDESDITFYLDDIHADVARPTYIELQTPNNLADTSLQLYTHNGTAYQLCRTCELDSAYASVSDTDANCTLANGTKFSDVYGTGNGISVFPKGESGQSKNGSLTGSSITYSGNKGTLKRIGLRVDLPPAGTAAPAFSACRLKIVTYYDDVNRALTKLPDLSGNGNIGTMSQVMLSDNALVFDGTSSYINAGSGSSFDFGTGNFSIITDIKFSSMTSGEHVILRRDNEERYGSNRRFFGFVVTTGVQNPVLFEIYDGANGGSKTTTAAVINDNNWHRIVGVRNGDIIRFYVDGAEVGTGTSGCAAYNLTVIDGFLSFGRYQKVAGGYFNGSMKRTKIYSRALSAEEIVADYNNQPISSSGLVAHWQPSPVKNMGSTTYVFADSTNASYGLQNVIKPWIALYDPEKTTVDFFLFTHRPRNLEFKRDETGQIHELTLYPGNGRVYHGRITYPNLTEA